MQTLSYITGIECDDIRLYLQCIYFWFTSMYVYTYLRSNIFFPPRSRPKGIHYFQDQLISTQISIITTITGFIAISSQNDFKREILPSVFLSSLKAKSREHLLWDAKCHGKWCGAVAL